MQAVDAALAHLLEQMHDDLAVAVRTEAMPPGFQVAAQIRIIVDFAVADHRDGAILVQQGLPAARAEIDDAETRMGQPRTTIRIDQISFVVGPR